MREKKWLLHESVREEFARLVMKAGVNRKKVEEARKLAYSRMCGRMSAKWWEENRVQLQAELDQIERTSNE